MNKSKLGEGGRNGKRIPGEKRALQMPRGKMHPKKNEERLYVSG